MIHSPSHSFKTLFWRLLRQLIMISEKIDVSWRISTGTSTSMSMTMMTFIGDDNSDYHYYAFHFPFFFLPFTIFIVIERKSWQKLQPPQDIKRKGRKKYSSLSYGCSFCYECDSLNEVENLCIRYHKNSVIALSRFFIFFLVLRQISIHILMAFSIFHFHFHIFSSWLLSWSKFYSFILRCIHRGKKNSSFKFKDLQCGPHIAPL